MADKGFFIEALPREGVVTFLALVREKELRPKRNGGLFLHLVLSDRTGELDAKVWDNPQDAAGSFERDEIVKVRGTVELYNERPQLIVQRIRRCEAGEFQEADFCPASLRNPEEMFTALRSFAESVVNEHIRALLQSVLGDPAIAPALKVAPAAMRIHHACRGGLLEHVLSLCELAEVLVQKYSRLNRDWLIAGAVLHDIGKVEELGSSRRLSYTTRGQLVGHVALGLEIMERHVARLPDFPIELKSMLQHLIVSHHGEIQNGALRLPMFAEAFALFAMDQLDARLEQAWQLIDQGGGGEEWTPYVPSLQCHLFRGFRPDGVQGKNSDSGLLGAAMTAPVGVGGNGSQSAAYFKE